MCPVTQSRGMACLLVICQCAKDNTPAVPRCLRRSFFRCRPGRPRGVKQHGDRLATVDICWFSLSSIVSLFTCLLVLLRAGLKHSMEYSGPRLHVSQPLCLFFSSSFFFRIFLHPTPKCRLAGVLGRRPYAGTVGMLCACVCTLCLCRCASSLNVAKDALRTLRVLCCARTHSYLDVYFGLECFSILWFNCCSKWLIGLHGTET